MTTRHAGDFAGRVKTRDRFEILVEHATAQIGFDAAEIFSRQRKNLNRIVGRRVEFLRAFERLAEVRLFFQPGVKAFIIRFDLREKILQIFDAGFFAERLRACRLF